jgi:hypothetical protein
MQPKPRVPVQARETVLKSTWWSVQADFRLATQTAHSMNSISPAVLQWVNPKSISHRKIGTTPGFMHEAYYNIS